MSLLYIIFDNFSIEIIIKVCDNMKEFISDSEKRTMQIAEEICADIKGGSVVAFFGGMGMGKTAFVRGALKAYSNDSFVSSPTFALVHDYGGNPTIYHFDMYRVSSLDDLYSTGYFDYLSDDSILFIEWSENIESALPENVIKIYFSLGNEENIRIIRVEGGQF